jgi:hypothetical protein
MTLSNFGKIHAHWSAYGRDAVVGPQAVIHPLLDELDLVQNLRKPPLPPLDRKDGQVGRFVRLLRALHKGLLDQMPIRYAPSRPSLDGPSL